MNVAIVHYHLGPGGVTRVIEAASQALATAGIRHVVLTGDAPPSGWGVSPQTVAGASRSLHPTFHTIPGLDYLPTPGDHTAEALTESLRAAATEALGGPPDLWHFHNHSLGKNCLIPHVIARFVREDERVVLQIHDLAEQGRPANYQLVANCRTLYPFSPRIRYAFLNSRDLDLFTAAGLPPENAVLLPNPVTLPAAPPCDPPADSPSPILFAPVRGIRRKNLGELVLLAALAPAGTRVAVSRAPRNPEALPVHDTWRKFTVKHRLPIGFDVVDRFAPAAGAATGFESWLAHASHIVTTSVSEGFGLPFLEAAALGKPLIGRNLPHLAAEHARHGILAGRLYDRLLVPVDWSDLPILRDHLTTDLERNYRDYRRPLSQETINATLAALVRDGYLDFGNLPEPLQQGIIERLADPANRRILLVEIDGETQPAVDWLAAVIADRTPTATPTQLAPYSPDEYRKSLTALYQNLARQPAGPVRHLPADEILTAHLGPGSFHFLLSSLKPAAAAPKSYRAVIFDIYGTLLVAAPGGVKPDPLADSVLRDILRQFGHQPPLSPSSDLHAAVLRHHAAAGIPYPEVDLRALWREILSLEPGTDTSPLVAAIEAAWHPATPMPGAENLIQRLSRSGISLGLLSNAQSNTLASLGGVADLFAPELTLLSYQHGLAKPSPELFQILIDRLAGRGITPAETLFIGNDPLQDIVPAAAAGFQTALFTGHPDSLRPGDCHPDHRFQSWPELVALF
jgi:FMN phosphatase YigB (HAD superfamily)/glycosyltransferase involved in cell wall biosynthesis